MRKTTSLHVHHAYIFMYISLPSLHVVHPWVRTQTSRKRWFLGIQLQENSHTFNKVSELE